MTTATEFSHATERPVDVGDIDLTVLHHDPLHVITPLPWSVPEWLALAALACCFVGAGLLWVGW